MVRDVMFDEDTLYDPSERQLPLAPEAIEIIETIDNPPLDEEVEPTQIEIPFIHQEINLPEPETEASTKQQQHTHSGLLTPSTDASLSRYATPENN